MRSLLPGSVRWTQLGPQRHAHAGAPSASAAQIQRDGRSRSTSIASSEMNSGAV
jgi:hypothetical protein